MNSRHSQAYSTTLTEVMDFLQRRQINAAFNANEGKKQLTSMEWHNLKLNDPMFRAACALNELDLILGELVYHHQ